MSDTPRTDAEIERICALNPLPPTDSPVVGTAMIVSEDFARQLEREIIALKLELAKRDEDDFNSMVERNLRD